LLDRYCGKLGFEFENIAQNIEKKTIGQRKRSISAPFFA
jgi:2-oxoglutarate dehydrogenase complex dehydrogenase (E1) component-like enzyme